MLRAAVVQLSAFDIQQRTQALERAVAMVHKAAEQRPHLVLLPECTYPSYYLGDQNAPGIAQDELDHVMRTFADLARQYRLHLAVGLPERQSGKLYNSAFLFGPQGEVIGKVRKSFLWHFDAQWFSGGDEFPVFDTALGKIGMLICADARLPEVARMLKLGGAEIILDPTNWVSSGGNRATLTNPQYEYMVQARALENKVWFLAANKIGLERRSILFCGRSCVVAPSGERVIEASSDREEILVYEVDLGMTARDEIVPGFSCVADRRPETYGLLTVGHTGYQEQSIAAADISPWLAVCVQDVGDDAVGTAGSDGAGDAAGTAGSDGADGAEIISVIGAQLAVFSSFDSMKVNGIVDPGRYAPEMGIALAAAHGGSAMLFLPDGRCETYHKVHGRVYDHAHDKVCGGGDRPINACMNPVFQTQLGKVAFILDEEGLIPEPARIAALQGAELIIWISGELYPLHEKLARTRAAENCCYLAVCFPAERHSNSGNMLIAPNGTVLAVALPGESQIIAGMINPVLAHNKLIVPGTDVVAGRIPEKYSRLVHHQ